MSHPVRLSVVSSFLNGLLFLKRIAANWKTAYIPQHDESVAIVLKAEWTQLPAKFEVAGRMKLEEGNKSSSFDRLTPNLNMFFSSVHFLLGKLFNNVFYNLFHLLLSVFLLLWLRFPCLPHPTCQHQSNPSPSHPLPHFTSSHTPHPPSVVCLLRFNISSLLPLFLGH